MLLSEQTFDPERKAAVAYRLALIEATRRKQEQEEADKKSKVGTVIGEEHPAREQGDNSIEQVRSSFECLIMASRKRNVSRRTPPGCT